MPTKPNKPALPKATVIKHCMNTPRYPCGGEHVIGAFIPCRTAKEARAWVKLARMTPEERREMIAAQIFHPALDNRAPDKHELRRHIADVILKALHLT